MTSVIYHYSELLFCTFPLWYELMKKYLFCLFPTGLVEIEEGSLNEEHTELTLESRAVGRMSFASEPHVTKVYENALYHMVKL